LFALSGFDLPKVSTENRSANTRRSWEHFSGAAMQQGAPYLSDPKRKKDHDPAEGLPSEFPNPPAMAMVPNRHRINTP
jgi:hypothetical protein